MPPWASAQPRTHSSQRVQRSQIDQQHALAVDQARVRRELQRFIAKWIGDRLAATL